MRTNKKCYEEFLCSQGYEQSFDKKNIRILFNSNHGKITELIVENFYSPEEKYYLYKRFSLDFGNCLSDWDHWTLSDVLIKIFVSYQVPIDLRKKILLELCKVKEWRNEISFWIYLNWCENN